LLNKIKKEFEQELADHRRDRLALAPSSLLSINTSINAGTTTTSPADANQQQQQSNNSRLSQLIRHSDLSSTSSIAAGLAAATTAAGALETVTSSKSTEDLLAIEELMREALSGDIRGGASRAARKSSGSSKPPTFLSTVSSSSPASSSSSSLTSGGKRPSNATRSFKGTSLLQADWEVHSTAKHVIAASPNLDKWLHQTIPLHSLFQREADLIQRARERLANASRSSSSSKKENSNPIVLLSLPAKDDNADDDEPPGLGLLPLLYKRSPYRPAAALVQQPRGSSDTSSSLSVSTANTPVGADKSPSQQQPQQQQQQQQQQHKKRLLAATNYDFAMSFPRTLADVDVDVEVDEVVATAIATTATTTADGAPPVVDALPVATLPSSSSLTTTTTTSTFEYDHDPVPGLLNHEPPMPNDTAKACDQCGLPFSRLLPPIRTKLTCGYCGRSLCSSCCGGAQLVVPGFVLKWGTYSPQPVCPPCEKHLHSHVNDRMIDLARMTKEAVNVLGRKRMDTFHSARDRIVRYLYCHVLAGCPSAPRLLAHVPPSLVGILLLVQPHQPHHRHPHQLGIQGPLVSIADLLELQTARYPTRLAELAALLEDHLCACPHCTAVVHLCAAGPQLCKQQQEQQTTAISGGDLLLCSQCRLPAHPSCYVQQPQGRCLACCPAQAQSTN